MTDDGTDELGLAVRRLMEETARMPQGADADAHLYDDLGVASVDALMLLEAVEERFRIRVPDERWIEATSIRRVTDLVRSLVGSERAS